MAIKSGRGSGVVLNLLRKHHALAPQNGTNSTRFVLRRSHSILPSQSRFSPGHRVACRFQRIDPSPIILWPNCARVIDSPAPQTSQGISMKRAMVWTKTDWGRVVTCSDCSWRTPVYGEDSDWVGEEFEFHVCADYPPLRLVLDLDKTG